VLNLAMSLKLTDDSERFVSYTFCTEDGVSRFLHKVDKYLPGYTVSHPVSFLLFRALLIGMYISLSTVSTASK
jgi:hypothetical protein